MYSIKCDYALETEAIVSLGSGVHLEFGCGLDAVQDEGGLGSTTNLLFIVLVITEHDLEWAELRNVETRHWLLAESTPSDR